MLQVLYMELVAALHLTLWINSIRFHKLRIKIRFC